MGRKNNYYLDRSRVIGHLDIDCFSVQVALKYFPQFKGKACATRYSNCLIDSVSYEAKGVTRGMTTAQAIKLYPGIKIFTKNKSPGLWAYGKASKDVFDLIQMVCGQNDVTIEKTSIDDLFLDLTQLCNHFIEDNYSYDSGFIRELEVVVEGGKQPFKIGSESNMCDSLLTPGVVFMSDLCYQIFNKTGLRCSAGISCNKLLAKISCKINKPNTITVMASKAGIARIFENYEIGCVTGFGGKFGQIVKNRLNISTLKELRGFRRQKLMRDFGREKGNNLWEIARGIDNNPVVYRPEFKTMSFSKKYSKGKNCNESTLFDDLVIVCKEMSQKLLKEFDKNKRNANGIKFEYFTKQGLNLNTTFKINGQHLDPNSICNKIIRNVFQYIINKQSIRGFRLTPLGLD